jgi:hypothetical protein
VGGSRWCCIRCFGFFLSFFCGLAVAVMRLGPECDGCTKASGVSAQSVLGGGEFNYDLTGCFGKGGTMVMEARHGWGCYGNGGLKTMVVVLGIDQIVGWCGLA